MPRRRTRTGIFINLSFPQLAERHARLDCDGVGLMRAEFYALTLGVHPRKLLAEGGAERFISAFADGIIQVASAFAPRPVLYRTLDLKSNEYAGLDGGAEFEQKEENPMLGFRGTTRYLREPEVFRLELQAVHRARRQNLPNVRLMLPFVRFPAELKQCREWVGEEGLLDEPGFQLWMMAELPINVFRIDEYLPLVDGVSIGSNDLTQLILGIDRDSSRMASIFDERDPAVITAIEQIARAGRRAGTAVSICGNAPSRYPEMIPKLIAAGLTSLSVSPERFEATVEAVAQAEAELGITPGA
jgi:pyruvate,water dikinase